MATGSRLNNIRYTLETDGGDLLGQSRDVGCLLQGYYIVEDNSRR